MTIDGGYRVHDGRYRMPDLLTREEMFAYFAATYGVGIEFRELTEDERELLTGVGIVPAGSVVSDSDRELATLRQKLGIVDLEAKLDVVHDGYVKELDSRTMSPTDFEDKYGPQPTPAPPVEESDEEVEEVKEEEEETQEPVEPISDSEQLDMLGLDKK